MEEASGPGLVGRTQFWLCLATFFTFGSHRFFIKGNGILSIAVPCDLFRVPLGILIAQKIASIFGSVVLNLLHEFLGTKKVFRRSEMRIEDIMNVPDGIPTIGIKVISGTTLDQT